MPSVYEERAKRISFSSKRNSRPKCLRRTRLKKCPEAECEQYHDVAVESAVKDAKEEEDTKEEKEVKKEPEPASRRQR